ncbi:carboxymuconolactone decarboxylase family protein [Candidatus Woesearchaeota archaeon]|nr:carboxymuconolactone decarboxylase family protein [Candidatus Woesearchaeota archaeon]
MQAFKHFLQSVEAGSLDLKTKELIIIGLALKSQCSYCISLHVKKALDAGATKQEIVETIWLAAMMGGGPVFMYGQEALNAVEEFSK